MKLVIQIPCYNEESNIPIEEALAKYHIILDEKYNDYLKTWRRDGFNCYNFSQTNVFN